MKKCTWCGQEYPDDAKVCSTDGRPLERVGAEAVPNQTVGSSAKVLNARPAAITVICCLGFLGALLSFVTLVTHGDAIRELNPAYPPIIAFNALVVCVCMFGLFKMRRWALYIYTALCVIGEIVLLAMGGHLNIFAIALRCVVIAIGFAYWSRMK